MKGVSVGKAVVCGRCGTKPDAQWPHVDDNDKPVGSCCRRCWRPYCQSEYADKADFEGFCSRCQTDEDYNDEIELSAAILARETDPHWVPQEVSTATDFAVKVTRRFIGIPRADFRAMAGIDISAAGLVETDLRNELGQNYRGFLMQHPTMPWLEYEMSSNMSLRHAKILLQQANHSRPAQGHATMEAEREKRDHSHLVTKLRNCTVTPEDVAEKLGKDIFGTLRGSASANVGASGGPAPSMAATARSPGSTGPHNGAFQSPGKASQASPAFRRSEATRSRSPAMVPGDASRAAPSNKSVSISQSEGKGEKNRLDKKPLDQCQTVEAHAGIHVQ